MKTKAISTAAMRMRRRGATAVEFALVAPMFFLLVMTCFEFGRAHLIEAFVEESSFRAARHVAVFGATIDEAVAIAEQNMAIMGVDDDDVTVIVEPMVDGVVQDEIDFDTDLVRVLVGVPLNADSGFLLFFSDRTIEKETLLMTERLNN